MNIKPTDLIAGASAYKNQAVQAKRPGVQTRRDMQPDEFILSSNSAELHSLARQAREVSEVRQDVVADLRGRVQSGAYRVDSYDLAGKILDTYKGIV